MSWNRGLLPVQNIRLKKIVFESVQSQQQLCLPFRYVLRWTRNRMAGMQMDPLKIIGLQRLFVFKFPSYQDRKDGHFQILYPEQLNSGLSVTIMQFNHFLFHLTIFLSTGDFFLTIELLLLPQL